MKTYLFTAAIVTALAALASSGCAPTRYSYAPVSTTSAELEGAAAAVYPIPAGAPRGEVRLAMLGLGSLRTAGAQNASADAIHLALAVSNRSDEAWTVDPSEQRLTLTVKRERSDVYATTGDLTPPSPVLVPSRSTRVVDLYFPLPIQLQNETAPPPFDVIWTVHAGGRTVTERTAFQRFLAAPTPDEELDLRRPYDLRDHDQGRPGPESPERKPLLPLDDSSID